MTLEKYNQKRDASKTPEPFGGKSKEDKLRFVIQKHAASHLHYDFRLEMEGVLKSWAVPKGPSLDPDVKRLAMMVEDHPYDYRNFEGIIPQGEYGGGTVIVWDEGFYEPYESEVKTTKGHDKELLDGLHSGKIKFVLMGKKLKGAFALVKAHGRGENGWLLMKLEDKYASNKDIALKDKSVISGKTLEQVAKTSKNIYGQKAPESEQEALEQKVETTLKKPKAKKAELLLKEGRKVKMLTEVKPMLATLVNEPFDTPGWTYEVKWDGYRALAYIKDGKSELQSRNLKTFTEKYYPIAAVMDSWSINALLDGEILVIGKDGKANFSALQNWRSEADGDLVYYAFDLLWYEGRNITGLPLSERQAILKEILPTNDDHVRLSRVFDTNGLAFFEAAQKMGLEGIMAKKADSTYAIDSRSKDWLKIKVNQRQEVVIGGFTKNEGTAKQFSSLLLGVYNNEKFEYVGKVGTGFSDKKQKEMMALFEPLITSKIPFDTEPDVNKPSRFRPNPPKAKATWLKPELVCEVSFIEVTGDGVFRHPSFEGMRSDKKASEVVRETASETKAITTPAKADKLIAAPRRDAAKTLLNPKEETQVKKVNGHNLKFSNLGKVYWPEEGYTKRDMFNYYYQVAEYILPHLKDRPLSLNRFPSGIQGKSFYQKDVKGKAPDWAITYPYTNSDGEDKEFLVGDNEATLLWMASLGCIEMNPWFSRTTHPDNPDYCVIDLDPAEKTTFEQVIQAAREVKDVLDALAVPSYVKTSGSTGIHIYIPLGAKYTYDQSQMFARLLVSIVHDKLPDFTSLERKIKDRNEKMYLDFLQNRPGATIACAYSLRPKPGATVSMPLHWDEVKKGLKMSDFTINNAIARIRSEGDLFKATLEEGIDMEKALDKARTIYN
ncbi:MAG: DNA ligase D [Bacteroidia bacterium]